MATAGRSVDKVAAKFPNEVLKEEIKRLATFDDKSWRGTGIESSNYAKAGFFYTGQDNTIKCPFCYLVITDIADPKPDMGTKLPSLHAWLSGNCMFIQDKFRSKNESLQYDAAPSLHGRIDQPSADMEFPGFETKPKHIQLKDYTDRKNTYSGFPTTGKPAVHDLAEAGFFYNPSITARDKVTCYWCDGSLEGWDSNDVPLHEHSKYYPGCGFLRIKKGTTYILSVLNSMTEAEKRSAQNLCYNGSGRILANGYAAYFYVTKRELSFTNCTRGREFAEMGFHETFDNCMMCYSCGLTVSDFNSLSKEQVKSIHRQFTSTCEFLDIVPAVATEGSKGILQMVDYFLHPCGCSVPDHCEAVITICPNPACQKRVDSYRRIIYNRANE